MIRVLILFAIIMSVSIAFCVAIRHDLRDRHWRITTSAGQVIEATWITYGQGSIDYRMADGSCGSVYGNFTVEEVKPAQPIPAEKP